MRQDKENVRITVDAYTRVCLTVLAVLLTALVVGLWADGTARIPEARAAENFLNSAAQRVALLAAQRKTTEKLDELIRLLKSGEIEVQVVQKEAKPGGKPHAASPKHK